MTRQLKKEIWPHCVRMKPFNFDDSQYLAIEYWLSEHMGAFKSRWNSIHRYDATDFYFRTSKDATYFSLVWL
jgi:aromatic ring-cleaving dioxygenase